MQYCQTRWLADEAFAGFGRLAHKQNRYEEK